jgi:multicomponent Na+:H+ antiporter subunit B
MIEEAIVIILLFFMIASAYALVRLRNLFAVVMLSGIYSLFAAAVYVVMDAVDVAFTEAAVGAGVSTVLMLSTLALTTKMEKVHKKPPPYALVLVVATGALLIYGTLDMPRYGDPSAPIHQHVANRYIEKSGAEVGLPNIVTSVLASYRGFDTLGETAVVFTAAIGVLAIIGRVKGGSMPSSTVARRRKEDEPGNGGTPS